MSSYVYSERQVETLVESSQRMRGRFCFGAAVVLVAAAFLIGWLRPAWIFGAGNQARGWVIAALFLFFAGPLADSLWCWKSRAKSLRQSFGRFRVELSDDGVKVSAESGVRELRWKEISRAEEVGWGLYLRSAKRYEWIFIPSRIEGFGELKRELVTMGIPVVEAGVAPNWEELVGIVVLAATIVCAIVTRSLLVLSIDLAVAVMVAAAGFVITSANPENLPKMRWARLGVFVPVLMTASMLWSAWR